MPLDKIGDYFAKIAVNLEPKEDDQSAKSVIQRFSAQLPGKDHPDLSKVITLPAKSTVDIKSKIKFFESLGSDQVVAQNISTIAKVIMEKHVAHEPQKAIIHEEPAETASLLQQSAELATLIVPESAGDRIRDRLEMGEDGQALLQETMEEGMVSEASWLVDIGARLDQLELSDALKADKNYLWLQLKNAAVAPTPETLDHFAIDVGYGYKTANLMVLQDQLSKIKLEACDLEVPSFIGLSDLEMQNSLFQAIPELENQWDEFLNSFDEETKQLYIKEAGEENANKIPLKITPKGHEIISEIQQKIKDYFKNDVYSNLQVEDWLKENNPEFIIVRSTGKEDSDTNSNAGGNDSIPYVKPNRVAISSAMGQVIASYFGEKSITQRIGAGDKSLFTEKPFIPVLLQVMIGENVGGVGSQNEDIPRSGVMFTCQNDKAAGKTTIQCAPGNNEGIVASAVPVDTYFVDENHSVHAVVRKKSSRFVSKAVGDQFKGAEIRNQDPALIRQQALPDTIIKDLKVVADTISTNYGAKTGSQKPMDIEYTVKLKVVNHTKPVIYPLQARPLVNIRTTHQPSYLDINACEKVPAEKIGTFLTLIDGNSYVRQVTNPNEVLFVDDMPQALDAYHKFVNGMSTQDAAAIKYDYPQKLKAIFIKKTAPSTSHESVMLRPTGIPILVVDTPADYEQIRKLLQGADPENPCYLDPQRGLMVNHRDQIMNEGFISYPIPLEVTCPISPLIAQGISLTQAKTDAEKQEIIQLLKTAIPAFNQKIQDLVATLSQGAQLHSVKDAKHPDGLTLHRLFEWMATGNEEQAKVALASLISYLHKNLAAGMHQSEGILAGANMPKFMSLEAILNLVREEIIPALKAPSQSLERLYHLRFLEALVFQAPAKNVVGGFSFGLGAITHKKEKEVLSQVDFVNRQMTYNNIFLLLQKNNIWNQTIQQHWTAFVNTLTPDEVIRCSELLQKLERLNMVSPWLNLCFDPMYNQNITPGTLIETAEKRLNRNATTLKWIEEKVGRLDSYENQIEQWKTAKHVVKSYEATGKQFLEDITTAVQSMGQADQITRLALLEYVSKAVNAYDKTIKAVKENGEFGSDKEKVKYFALMLKPYLEMMKEVSTLVPYNDQIPLVNSAGFKTISNFDEYECNLEAGHSYQFGFYERHNSIGFKEIIAAAQKGTATAEELEARPQFNVNSMIYGSKADLDFSAHWPSRLEEYFTTFHQNMEKVIQIMKLKNGLNADVLPNFARPLIDKITEVFEVPFSEIRQEGHEIIVGFNIPLRQHAGKLSLRLDPKKPDQGFQLETLMMGNDEHDRWDLTAAYAAYFVNRGDGLSFVHGAAAQIDYLKDKRESVAFVLQVPITYQNTSHLIGELGNLMKLLSIVAISAGEHLKQWERNGPINLNQQFFRDSFYLSQELFEKFEREKNNSMLAEACLNTLSSLAQKQLPDYERVKKWSTIFDDSSPDISRGLKMISFLYLVRAYDHDPDAIKPFIDRVVQDQAIQKMYPDELISLKKATRPFDEQYQELVAQNDIDGLFNLAKRSDNEMYQETAKKLLGKQQQETARMLIDKAINCSADELDDLKLEFRQISDKVNMNELAPIIQQQYQALTNKMNVDFAASYPAALWLARIEFSEEWKAALLDKAVDYIIDRKYPLNEILFNDLFVVQIEDILKNTKMVTYFRGEFQELIDKKDYLNAFVLADRLDQNEWKEEAIPLLFPELMAERQDLKDHFEANIAKLWSLTSAEGESFDKNVSEIVPLAFDCLIGLSQFTNFRKMNFKENFGGLAYELMEEGVNATNNILTAVPLYLIQAYKTGIKDVQNAVKSGLVKLSMNNQQFNFSDEVMKKVEQDLSDAIQYYDKYKDNYL